jgi:hypothetical protein
MSVASTASEAASVDWNVIAAALGTFIATGAATAWGLLKGKKKFESGKSEATAIVGGTIMETASMSKLTIALTEASETMKEHTNELRRNTAEMQRATDIGLLRGK